VWRADQASDFLMNTMIADNTVFPDASVTVDAPVSTGPTFADWIAATRTTGEPALDDFLAAATDRDYAPRSLYGRYLQQARQRVLDNTPDCVRIECRETEVISIAETHDGYEVTFADGTQRAASAVVLATGHLDAPPRKSTTRIGAGHPADYPLDRIEARSELLLRGAGLNAFDVIARLTLGRSGTFRDGRYWPSGREPHIWITSRRGLPFHARVDTPGFRPPVAFLNPERVAELCAAPRLDFARDVLPLLVADLELAWYSRILPSGSGGSRGIDARNGRHELSDLRLDALTEAPGSPERQDDRRRGGAPLTVATGGMPALGRAELRKRVEGLLAEVGLDPELVDAYPDRLSGGMRQRAGIARALSVEPALLVADEPVSALDVSVQAQVLNLLVDLQRKRGLAFLFISHDLTVVRHMCSRIAVLNAGSIAEIGESAEVLGNPRSEHTRALLAAAPDLERVGWR
jgi:ABC-type oligopeptide transport system ATPase subunit